MSEVQGTHGARHFPGRAGGSQRGEEGQVRAQEVCDRHPPLGPTGFDPPETFKPKIASLLKSCEVLL